ncbi:MAG: glutamine synthetase family protein [Saprospiraceae bacterium]|nr:glutamine synthetase family protein [Saprospiraceae bacterium]
MNDKLQLNPNPLVSYLGKPSSEFTKSDIIHYVEDNGIEMINFRYIAGDGRLKTLNFVINSKRHLDRILTTGERVDGSSLFSHIEAGASDLYVIPRYKTAFENPFTDIPSLDILCSFYTKYGEPMESAPEYVLKKAHDSLKEQTGMSFEAMGELEYYVISEKEAIFESTDQKGYHESFPFNKWEMFRTEAMAAIASTGGTIKYGHSEVGNFSVDDKIYEQNEIEFLPTNVEDAADQLVIAKWILRTMAYKYGVTVTFAPKITVGKAGSGLHIHTKLVKDGKNMFVTDGKLNEIAKKTIAGYLSCAASLTAFGNTNPTSYFRLVPHQEAPTNICWGDRNRSVLVRVPLGWRGKKNMAANANPLEENFDVDFSDKQTIEFRCPDGSADIYLLLAGLTVAARHGFEMANSLELAEKSYVDIDIFKDEFKDRLKNLKQLPASCWESAEYLKEQRSIYEKYNVFSTGIIDGIICQLKSHKDKDIRDIIKYDQSKILKLVEKHFHCG